MRHRKFFYILIILLISIISFSITKAIKSNYFVIKEIEISNNKIIKTSYLEDAFKKLINKNIFFIKKDNLLPKEINLLIEDISIKRKFPDKICLIINEKFPLMYLDKTQKNIINKDGYYLKLNDEKIINYDYLTNINLNDSNNYLNKKIVMSKNFYIISNYLQEILKINNDFYISSFYIKDSYIYLTDAENKVQLKLNKDYKHSLQRYFYLKNEGYINNSDKLIDFTIDNQAIIK